MCVSSFKTDSSYTVDEKHAIEFTTYEAPFRFWRYRFPFTFYLAHPEYSISDPHALGDALYESNRVHDNRASHIISLLLALVSGQRLTPGQWVEIADEVKARRLRFKESPSSAPFSSSLASSSNK